PPLHLAPRARRGLRGLLAAAKSSGPARARLALRARLRPRKDAARGFEGLALAARDGRLPPAHARGRARMPRTLRLRLRRPAQGRRIRLPTRPRTRAPAPGDARVPLPNARPVEEDAAPRERRDGSRHCKRSDRRG